MADDRKSQKMTDEERAAFEAKIDAAMQIHSGHPLVTVQEWALLVRARADRPVSFEEILSSLISWFDPMLSLQEFADLIFGSEDKGWIMIVKDEEGQRHAQTTELGEEVLASVQRPLMRAGLFSLTGTDPLARANTEDDQTPPRPPASPRPDGRPGPQSTRRP